MPGLLSFRVFVILIAACSLLRGADYESAIQRFTEAANLEVKRGSLTGVSVALIGDQRLLYVGGFGLADKARSIPATSGTVYRAGSISKLFTALMALQLAEAGRLDIDKPITDYLPKFKIVDPFGKGPVNLRQLMCHRSGLIRESPVGGYFDDAEPGIEETVASISDCVLVYPPGTKTKYSNIGVTVVGQAAARVAGKSFDDYQSTHFLRPIGMTNSDFLLERNIKRRLAKGYMPVAQSSGGFREIVAPQFELGTLPAGNLYTTAEDLARFVSFLFAEGRAEGGPLIKPQTLAEMFTPQLTTNSNGFGLGFAIGHYRGHRMFSHSGAVYGFTSSLIGLMDQKLGVVVLANDDLATGPVRNLTSTALDLLLEATTKKQLPAVPEPIDVSVDDRRQLLGDYESESWWAKVEVRGHALTLNISGQRMVLAAVAPLRFEANGRIAHRSVVTFERGPGDAVTGFTALDQRFRRLDPGAVPTTPVEWKDFLGSYGPAFIPLIVSIKHGHLYAMTENEFDYRLTPLNRYVFKMPPGLYTDEHLVFQVDKNGRAHTAVLANMPLKRE